MALDDDAFVRDKLPLLRKALQQATKTNGEVSDINTRAALGFFILRAARSGILDPDELARIALSDLETDPRIVEFFAQDIGDPEV